MNKTTKTLNIFTQPVVGVPARMAVGVSARLVVCGAVLASVCLLASGSLRADTIVQATGKELSNVKIIDARWDKVQYEMSGRTLTIPGERVVSIARDSNALQSGRRALDAGKFSSAVKALTKVAEGRDGWEKAEAAYLVGVAYQRGGSKKAIAAFKAYLDEHKESKDWFVPAALYGMGQAAVSAGQGGTANKYFGDLSQYGKSWKLKGLIGQGRALLVGKKFVEARQKFSQVSKDSSAPVALKHEASAGRADVLLVQKDYDGAIKELNSAFFRNPRNVVYDISRAQATRIMGECYLGKGGKENLERAEIWLLKVTGLYGVHAAEVKRAAKSLVAVYQGLGNSQRAAHWQKVAGS